MNEKSRLFSHRDIDTYFSGYEKRRSSDPVTGRRKAGYVYTGDYYIFTVEPVRFSQAKLISMLLGLAGIALFTAPNILGAGGAADYAGILALLAIIPMLYLVTGLITLAKVRRPQMTVREYIFGLKRAASSASGVLVLLGIAFLGELIYVISSGLSALTLAGLGYLLCNILSLAAFFGLSRTLRRIMSTCIREAESETTGRAGQELHIR